MKELKRTIIKDLLRPAGELPIGQLVNVKGWVRTKRGNKKVAFIALNDGSIIHNIQIVADVEDFGEEALKPVTTGSCISVDGILVE